MAHDRRSQKAKPQGPKKRDSASTAPSTATTPLPHGIEEPASRGPEIAAAEAAPLVVPDPDETEQHTPAEETVGDEQPVAFVLVDEDTFWDLYG